MTLAVEAPKKQKYYLCKSTKISMWTSGHGVWERVRFIDLIDCFKQTWVSTRTNQILPQWLVLQFIPIPIVTAWIPSFPLKSHLPAQSFSHPPHALRHVADPTTMKYETVGERRRSSEIKVHWSPCCRIPRSHLEVTYRGEGNEVGWVGDGESLCATGEGGCGVDSRGLKGKI
jgi:hypothetical protein